MRMSPPATSSNMSSSGASCLKKAPQITKLSMSFHQRKMKRRYQRRNSQCTLMILAACSANNAVATPAASRTFSPDYTMEESRMSCSSSLEVVIMDDPASRAMLDVHTDGGSSNRSMDKKVRSFAKGTTKKKMVTKSSRLPYPQNNTSARIIVHENGRPSNEDVVPEQHGDRGSQK